MQNVKSRFSSQVKHSRSEFSDDKEGNSRLRLKWSRKAGILVECQRRGITGGEKSLIEITKRALQTLHLKSNFVPILYEEFYGNTRSFLKWQNLIIVIRINCYLSYILLSNMTCVNGWLIRWKKLCTVRKVGLNEKHQGRESVRRTGLMSNRPRA